MHKLSKPQLLFLVLLITAFLQTSLTAQSYLTDSLTAQLSRIQKSADLPGFAAAIVSDKKIMYKSGFGYSDLATKEKFTTETIQNIGSISKTFIAVALMKLVEEGKLKLDDDIDQYLSFKITNPNFPNNSITIRQLATHTSSLTDGENEMVMERSYLLHEPTDFKKEDLPDDWAAHFKLYNTNERLTMARFLHNTYCKDGEWYDAKNFLNAKPGTIYEYTNIGATLLAHIIETVAGKRFDQYVKEIILDPLNMSQTYWSWAEADSSNNRITHYLSNNQRVPAYDLITYPNGGLITSISDFTIYLQEMIKGLNGRSDILSFESYKEMMSNQLIPENFQNAEFGRSIGLLWRANSQGDNISASGADPGTTTHCMFTTGGNIGYVFFINKSIYDNQKGEAAFHQIRQLLIKYAGKLRRE